MTWPRRAGKRKNPEHDLQRAAIQWLRLALVPPAFATSIETGRAGRMARMMDAARGVTPGFPDMLVFWVGGVIGLELKSAKGVVSDQQIAMAHRLSACGVSVYTCRTLEQIEAACRAKGVELRARVSQPEPAAVKGARLT